MTKSCRIFGVDQELFVEGRCLCKGVAISAIVANDDAVEAHRLLIAYSELLINSNEGVLLCVFVGKLLHSWIPKIELDSVL